MTQTPQWASERIEEARKQKSKTLNLNWPRWQNGAPQLTEFPHEILVLKDLEELSVRDNQIRIIPQETKKLSHLKRLDVRGNTQLEKLVDMPGLIMDFKSYVKLKGQLSREHIFGLRITSTTFDLPKALKWMPNLNMLDLNSARLDILPEWIGQLANLTTLDLSSNKLTTLPESVGRLVNLTRLSLFDNQLRSLPESISQLENLTELILGGNQFADLPEWIGQFVNLTTLYLGSNQLTSLPKSISLLESLTRFILGGNQFTALPEWISRLENLTSLSLYDNKLTTLPEPINQLEHLTKLDLRSNQFTEIPEVIFSLSALEFLSFENFDRWIYKNQIKHIPPAILQLKNLTEISFEGNPLETPPLEVVQQGMPAIREYFRQIETEGTDYLCEAKLLIVGEPGAGKTSLAKKIENEKYQLVASEKSTEGIQVLSCEFPCEITVQQAGEAVRLAKPFRVNIWDFGGQEIYHATHQFFLTKRSLYALVADTRAEDTDFNYWLNIVELLSDNSPLLIVKNEKQDRHREINERQLRGQFTNLKETLATNLADNRGLPELVQKVRHYLQELPHVGAALPKTWVQVRRQLEQEARHYISLETYLDICSANGFKKREDSLQLSGYLHDLGVCLHFQNDALLNKTVILKPKWGTDAVYHALDDDAVIKNYGRFTRADLSRIWREPEYANMHGELLQLMITFKLCYQIPGSSDTYIAPQLLRVNLPQMPPWEEEDNLVLRYTYEFMPKGIITHFIVATHAMIENHEWVWREGVILKKGNTRAEVVEYYNKREIRVRIAGANKRDLMMIVMHELGKIHDSYKRLRYSTLIPCNCAACKGRQEPHFYSLEVLEQFRNDRQREIQCQKSYKMVEVIRLIDDVMERQIDEEKIGSLRSSRLQPMPMIEPKKEVFVSYTWGGESETIVDRIVQAFQDRGVTIIRDKKEVRYKDRIKEFMERMGRGKCVIAVISKKYLESDSCTFELVQIAKHGQFHDRIFPIILGDANIYKPIERLKYVEFWEEKIRALDEAMKSVSAAKLPGIRKDIDHYAEVRSTIDELTDTLRDTNALTPEMHSASGFEELFKAVAAKLAE